MTIIGLYDPVLDDYEPIYESIERADSDLRSEPTEVLDPQDLSLDDPNILDPRITDPSLWDSGYATTPLTESRSLNASPFVPNTKPYRPFSTEPLQVPLEDPIILNPNYKDTFNLNGDIQEFNPEEDELICILPLDKNVEAKFKLPVSEKYDPEWEKKVRSMLEKCAESGKRETQQVESELVYYSGKPEKQSINKTVVDSFTVKRKSDQIIKEGIKIDETRVEESVKQSVEETALEVVDESIERAVSVTEDIKKEIEEELRSSSTTELQEEEYKTKTDMTCFTEEIKEKEYRKESLSKYHKPESVQYETSKKLMQETEIIVIENEDSGKIHQQEENLMEEIKQAMDDTMESGKVRKQSSAYEKKEHSLNETDNNNQIMEESETVKKYSTEFQREDMQTTVVENSRKVLQTEEIKSKHRENLKSSDIFRQANSNCDGKQKAYMIGLQTIPHIKGFVQSSYHFDLLLRTFFVHLTDVMVALSRFLLTQPSQELESKAEKVVKEELTKEFTMKDTRRFEDKSGMVRRHKEGMNTEHETKRQEDKRQETNEVQTKQTITLDKSEMQQKQNMYKQEIKQDDQKLKVVKSQEVFEDQDNFDICLENEEKKKKSGAEMAQRTQRKSRDLTKKMDAVINEFETKTGIEESLEVTEHRSRRSRSRSQIEEEVMRDSDPLEWLDKVNSRRAFQGRSDVTSTEQELRTYTGSKESKRAVTKTESRTTKVEPGKQMYIAIVESHVYTNNDAILEDQTAEISESVSTQSTEGITTALESFEAISTQNVAKTNVIQSDEKQQAVEVLINALQEVVQEKQEVLEAVTGSKSQKTEEYYGVTLEAADNGIDIKKSEYNAVSKKEVLTLVAAEATEIIDESKLKSFETKEAKTKIAVESSEENYKQAVQSTIETVLETSKEESTELKVKQQAVTKVESLAIAVAESTDVVVDDSKVDIFENKEVVSQKAAVSSEETYKNAAVGITEVMFETAEEKHSDLSKTKEVTIKQEGQHLAVAGIIETRTEICKEQKKPAEDEYASIKIVKEQIIDGEESTEIVTESELNVQQSSEVEISSQHTKSSVSEASYQSISQELTSVQESSRLAQESSILMQQTSTSSSKSHTSLHINTNLALQQRSDEIDENNNTPTPRTVPPTPLTDEYVFKLEIPLPKNQGTVVIEESPDREDPHIVKKGLVPYIETTIEEQIIYDPPLPTPPEDKVQSPVYTKPGLRGGAQPLFRKEYIREIERKSSLLASAIDETIKSIEEYKEEVGIDTVSNVTIPLPRKKTSVDTDNDITVHLSKPKNSTIMNEIVQEPEKYVTNGTADNLHESDALPGYKPVVFNPEAYQARLYEEVTRGTEPAPIEVKPYVNESGEPLGTVQGIVDGLEDATVDDEVAKELGKPGMTEENIAVLISGESEMLREAHVMGLTRVLTSHMTRPDDSSVDFQKIKPLVPSLKDSEVIKVLNEDMKRECEKKNEKGSAAEEKKWTTFLQKPKRAVPRVKFGYPGCVDPENIESEEPYKVKIVKQPKPKVAPDYKSEVN